MPILDEEVEESLIHWLDSLLAPTFALAAVGEVAALTVSIALFAAWCICRYRVVKRQRADRARYMPLHLAPMAPQRPRRRLLPRLRRRD